MGGIEESANGANSSRFKRQIDSTEKDENLPQPHKRDERITADRLLHSHFDSKRWSKY
jgi:hypothetical protein